MHPEYIKSLMHLQTTLISSMHTKIHAYNHVTYTPQKHTFACMHRSDLHGRYSIHILFKEFFHHEHLLCPRRLLLVRVCAMCFYVRFSCSDVNVSLERQFCSGGGENILGLQTLRRQLTWHSRTAIAHTSVCFSDTAMS